MCFRVCPHTAKLETEQDQKSVVVISVEGVVLWVSGYSVLGIKNGIVSIMNVGEG